jgi:hypothetical protein
VTVGVVEVDEAAEILGAEDVAMIVISVLLADHEEDSVVVVVVHPPLGTTVDRRLIEVAGGVGEMRSAESETYMCPEEARRHVVGGEWEIGRGRGHGQGRDR